MQERLTIAGLACAVLVAGCGEISVKKYLPFGLSLIHISEPTRPY